MPYNHTPAYNLKAVIQQTGVAADTLRAWERRYGLPHPDRTPGGHRLYSEYDIATIKWLLSRQKQGLSISRAVDQWKELKESGQDPLGEAGPAVAPVQGITDLSTARAAWVEACLAFNETAAEQALNQAFAANSIEVVIMEVIQGGLTDIGELWYRGTASVQQEHFASGLAMRKLDTLLSATPLPTRNESILVACPSDEHHIFPLLFLALFLRRRGWNVINLGANVPLGRMEEATARIQPNLVVLSAQQLTTAVPLRDMARFLHENGITVAYGGRIFNQLDELRKRIPAHFLGPTIHASLQRIEVLALKPEPPPQEEHFSAQEQALPDAYMAGRPSIERAVTKILKDQELSLEHLEIANHHMGGGLHAALQMGDPSYLSLDLEWLGSLLAPRGVPFEILSEYLEAYAQAVEQALDGESKPIVQWLRAYRQSLTLERP